MLMTDEQNYRVKTNKIRKSTLLIVLVEPSWLFIDMDRLSLGGDEIDETAGEVFNVLKSDTYLKNLKFLRRDRIKISSFFLA